MYIETVPNRGSPPAILLRESYRDGKSIRKRTLLNLSHWPAEHVEGLRGVLKGGVVLPPGEQPVKSASRGDPTQAYHFKVLSRRSALRPHAECQWAAPFQIKDGRNPGSGGI